MKPLKVLFAAAEVTPLAKVGGLADVVGALPKALILQGIEVKIVIPKYGSINLETVPHRIVASDVIVPFWGKDEHVSLIETSLPGSAVTLWMIDHEGYLGRDGVYPPPDIVPETTRFAFFAQAVMKVFETVDWWPDVLHCHDWHVSMLPVLLKILAAHDQRFAHMHSVLTIHNLALQGAQNAEELCAQMGISPAECPSLTQRDRTGMNILHLAQGIMTADKLNTVSPNYAKEIMTPEYGAGLQDVLRSRAHDLVGIVNGIDDHRFDPSRDPDIQYHYSAGEITNKAQNKKILQAMCNLPVQADIPTIGIVSRLTDQKGLDLIEDAAEQLMSRNLQLIILGTGNKNIEAVLQRRAQRYLQRMYVRIGFDASFAQKVYAGSDMFLMPSKFEPCGLGQMIAMRYGTVPIVRTTGGLVDTVSNIDTHGRGDGFSFGPYTGEALIEAVNRALALYQKREVWHTIVEHIMKKDFSWQTSSRVYLELYQAAMS